MSRGARSATCGPACARRTNGWEYHIKLVLPTGEFFEERRKSPVEGKTSTHRYAEARAAHGVRESFMTYSKTNNKPSTVYAKEGMLNAHLIPFFGKMRLDAIGPAEIEKY